MASAKPCGASLKPRNDGPAMAGMLAAVARLAEGGVSPGPSYLIGGWFDVGGWLMSRKRGRAMLASARDSGSSPSRWSTSSSAGADVSRNTGEAEM